MKAISRLFSVLSGTLSLTMLALGLMASSAHAVDPNPRIVAAACGCARRNPAR